MGLFGLGGSKPKLSDPLKTSQQQLGFNKDAAQTTNNAQGFTANKDGLYGSTQATYDDQGNLTGQTATSNLNTGGLINNFNNLSGNLPGQFADYSSVDPSSILTEGMNTYDALTQPGIQQGQNRINQEMANRGLPINDKISSDLQGNFDRQNAVARQGALSTLYGQLPGMQGQLIQNINTMQNQPYQQLANTQSLMGGINALNPQFANFSNANVAAPNYQAQVMNNDQMAMQAYQADQQALGGLLGGLGGLALTPMTGGFSNTLLGGGLSKLGGLFNSK